MRKATDYIFTSQRLGFRNWTHYDLDVYAQMGADKDVMEHFPKTMTRQEALEGIERFRQHFDANGYTYFAAEVLETSELIGFVGLAYQEYETKFTPATDIGWRLKKSAWGNGYATEGARRCLQYAFNDLALEYVVSVCTIQNHKSENVMKKIGMKRMGTFLHPKLKAYPQHEQCVWYKIENASLL
jgi:RimJ/RimL family protein N-acetyltransferase